MCWTCDCRNRKSNSQNHRDSKLELDFFILNNWILNKFFSILKPQVNFANLCGHEFDKINFESTCKRLLDIHVYGKKQRELLEYICENVSNSARSNCLFTPIFKYLTSTRITRILSDSPRKPSRSEVEPIIHWLIESIFSAQQNPQAETPGNQQKVGSQVIRKGFMALHSGVGIMKGGSKNYWFVLTTESLAWFTTNDERDKKYMIQLEQLKLRNQESGMFSRRPSFAIFNMEGK